MIVLEKARFPRRKVCGEFIAASGLALLARLGLGERLAAAAGPEVRTIALWTGEQAYEAPMPALRAAWPYPRALDRATLDALLLDEAARAGAEILQPAVARSLARTREGFVCRATGRRGEDAQIEARAVIAAHGSWEPGLLSTQPPRLAPRAEDVFGFQAHFAGAMLPPGRIVLAPFAGGYAGLVERAGGRSTLACCIRRDALAALRSSSPGAAAGEAILRALLEENRLLRRALESCTRESEWLGVGPLRPGRRPPVQGGLFVLGNAAAEAHPVVGEGIALALQSAALLAPPLVRALREGYSPLAARAVAFNYAWRLRRLASVRVWTSARFAALAMHGSAARQAQALLSKAPALLTLAARLSGKLGGGAIGA